MSAREVAGMIRWLPPEAALWRSTGTSWSTENELQAATIETLDAFMRIYITAHSKPNAQKPKPLRIPRPWEKAEKKQQSSTTIGELLSNGLSVRRQARKSGDGETWQE